MVKYIIVILFLALLAFLGGINASRRRRRKLANLASRWRLRFMPDDVVSLVDRLEGLYLMQLGHSRHLSNLIHGRWRRRQLLAFDYRFETGSGGDRAVHEGTVVAWQIRTRGGGVGSESGSLSAKGTDSMGHLSRGVGGSHCDGDGLGDSQVIRLGEGGFLSCLVSRRRNDFQAIGQFGSYQRIKSGISEIDGVYRIFSNGPSCVKLLGRKGLGRALVACGDVDWECDGHWLVFYSDFPLGVLPLARLIKNGAYCVRQFEGAFDDERADD